LDEKQSLPGDDIFDQADRGIRTWDRVLLCASKASLTSWWVDNEINKAFAKEQQLKKQHEKRTHALIPLSLDGFLSSHDWQRRWKDRVLSRPTWDFRNWKNHLEFEDQFEKSLRALRADDGGRESVPSPKPGRSS